MLKATRKARRIYKADRITIFAARQMLSYLGWIKHTDTYEMYLTWIKPIVNYQKLKRKIAVHDKRENGRKRYELVQSRVSTGAA